jgi:hypothetical protein
LSRGFGNERVRWRPEQWVELVDPENRQSAPSLTDFRVYRSADPRESAEAGLEPTWQRPSYDLKTQILGYPDGGSTAIRERAWHLRYRQLVSLLRQPHPVVYDTNPYINHLRVKGGPTESETWRIGPSGERELIEETLPPLEDQRPNTLRELDGFEKLALDELSRGNELVVKTSARELRLLGAVRARVACSKCHEGGPGRLLGAFTYRLTPTKDE